PSNHALPKATVTVTSVTASDSPPVAMIWVKLRPKPSRIIETCKIFLDEKVMPGCSVACKPKALRYMMPISMPKTGPPIIGTARPAYSATRAMATDKKRPGHREFLRGRAALLPADGRARLASGVTVADKA